MLRVSSILEVLEDGMGRRVERALHACAAETPAEFGPITMRAPAEAWPDELAWKPLLVTSDRALAWDSQRIARLIGPAFPEMLRPMLSPPVWEAAGDAWNVAVEDALIHLSRGAGFRSGPLPRIGSHGDLYAEMGDVLFVIDVKNSFPVRSKFRDPSPTGMRRWLEDKYTVDAGFPQVYSSIRTAHTRRIRLASKRIDRYPVVQPLVLSATRFPQQAWVTDLVEAATVVPDLGPVRHAPPRIWGMAEYVDFLACAAAAVDQGARVSSLLESYYTLRAERPGSLASWARKRLNPFWRPQQHLDVFKDCVDDALAWSRSATRGDSA